MVWRSTDIPIHPIFGPINSCESLSKLTPKAERAEELKPTSSPRSLMSASPLNAYLKYALLKCIKTTVISVIKEQK
jgi:hypothetical protein